MIRRHYGFYDKFGLEFLLFLTDKTSAQKVIPSSKNQIDIFEFYLLIAFTFEL